MGSRSGGSPDMKPWLSQQDNRREPVPFITTDEAWEIAQQYGGWRGVVRTCAAAVLIALFWSSLTILAICWTTP